MDAIKKTILPNVGLTCVTTDKFKTGFFSVSLLCQLSGENASKNALIPNVLRRGCSLYPDMESLAAALNELYGSAIEPAVRLKGEIQCPGFFVRFPDDRYLPDEDRLLEKAVALCGEIILAPTLKGGFFDPDYVESEKEKLCDQIRAIVNNKRGYALMRLKEIMCEDEMFGTDVLGSVEGVQKINPQILTKHYKHILENSEIQIFYCGSAKPERVELAVLEAFRLLPRSSDVIDINTEVRVDCSAPRYITETLDVTQGNLAIGFRMGDTMYAPDHAAILVFNAVYGGSVTSKLFANVRERLSLCYFASSTIERHKGVMFVSSGIQFEKYEDAKNEILAQLEHMRNNDISDEELEGAKKYVSTSLRTALDSQGALENFYLSQAIDGLLFNPAEIALRVETVTRDKVCEIARSIVLDTIYFLRAKEE